jgi:phage terminase large subunit-like protein
MHGYILDDSSIRATPDGWARSAVAAYHKLKGDMIVGEVNNGGEMVGHTILTVSPSANYKSVRATRGKQLRAEPIAALYEQGRIHHVGFFPELEDQMCEWVPGEKSPDRLDALVWALTELIIEEEIIEQKVIYNAMELVGNVDLMR